MSFSFLLIGLASLASLAAWIWLITLAFQNDQKPWGIILIVSIFIPVVGPFLPLIYIIQNWGIARRPAFLYLGALGAAVLGALIAVSELKRAASDMIAEAKNNPGLSATRNEDDGPPTIASDRGGSESATPSKATPKAPPPPIKPQSELRPPPTENRAANVAPVVPPEVARPDPAPVRCPLSVELVQLGEPGANSMRRIVARAGNTSEQPIQEAKLALTYFDARGLRLGRWSTVHSETTNMIGGTMTNEFSFQAFFVPQFTRDVRIEVEHVRFANGDRWPPLDPTLIPASQVRP